MQTDTSTTSRTRKGRSRREANLTQVPQRARSSAGITSLSTTPLPPERAVLSAPEKDGKLHHVHFGLNCEDAREVFVAGSFNNWRPHQTPLQRDSNGCWKTELMLPAGDYEYRFMVDGQWRDDLLATHTVANPFGGVNAVRHVSGS